MDLIFIPGTTFRRSGPDLQERDINRLANQERRNRCSEKITGPKNFSNVDVDVLRKNPLDGMVHNACSLQHNQVELDDKCSFHSN